MELTQFTILGERCSGTSYVQQLIEHNFNVSFNRDLYGRKHFFGHHEPSKEDIDRTLVIGMIRDPVDWLNSFFRNPWHIRREISRDPVLFLNSEVCSLDDSSKEEIMFDRNYQTGEPYKNFLELRYTKLQFLRELEKTNPNFIFVRYEDIRDDYKWFLDRISENYNIIKSDRYPMNITFYKDLRGVQYDPSIKKKEVYSQEDIVTHPSFDMSIEKELGYIS